MKRLILFLLFVGALIAVAFGQDIDTVVVAEPEGFRGFYEKYSGAIWMVLGLSGVSAFLWYRAEKIRDAFNEIVKAGEDGNVSEAEFQAILKALKRIWGKKE